MNCPLLWNRKHREKNFRIRMCCFNHTGKVRMKNEDNFLFQDMYLPMNHITMREPLLWTADSAEGPIVAIFDGMGGENAGELASYTAARTMAEFELPAEYSEENLTDMLLLLNRSVCEAGSERCLGQIGSTVTLLAFEKSSVWIADLGDSPAFSFRKGRLTRISYAHTDERRSAAGGIRRKPALTQFLGIEEEEFIQEPYVSRLDLKKGDIYLLCSDGLTDMVSEEEIGKILDSADNVEDAGESLLHASLEHGGRDNITIIVCEIH